MMITIGQALVQVQGEDGRPGALVRERNNHMPIEPSRSQDGMIDHREMIASSDNNHTFPAIDTVEFFKEAADRLDVVRCATASGSSA